MSDMDEVLRLRILLMAKARWGENFRGSLAVGMIVVEICPSC